VTCFNRSEVTRPAETKAPRCRGCAKNCTDALDGFWCTRTDAFRAKCCPRDRLKWADRLYRISAGFCAALRDVRGVSSTGIAHEVKGGRRMSIRRFDARGVTGSWLRTSWAQGSGIRVLHADRSKPIGTSGRQRVTYAVGIWWSSGNAHCDEPPMHRIEFAACTMVTKFAGLRIVARQGRPRS